MRKLNLNYSFLLFFSRTFESKQFPASIIPDRKEVFAPGCSEISEENFEILVANPNAEIEWLTYSSLNHKFPESSVFCSTTDINKIYIGRISKMNSTYVGKICPDSGRLLIRYESVDELHDNYEILTIKFPSYFQDLIGPQTSSNIELDIDKILTQTKNLSIIEKINAGSDSENECSVCFELPIQTEFVKCGHKVICSSCADEFKRRDLNCPICREKSEIRSIDPPYKIEQLKL